MGPSAAKFAKIALSLLVVGGGLGTLLYATAGNALEYYKHVDEVTPDVAAWQRKPLQLHGFVQPGSIQRRLDRDHQQLEYKFVATNCGQQITVTYAGTVPDTFKDGAEVVVKGTLDGSTFHSTEVMAKCPSKYSANAGPSTLCARGRAN